MTVLVTFVIKYWRGSILEEPHQDGACRKEETLLQVMRPVFCRSLWSQDTQLQTWNRGDVSLYEMFQAVPISRTS